MVKQMMAWIVGAEVGDEYVPMMLEELELDGARQPRPERRRRRRGLPRRHHRLRHVGHPRRGPAGRRPASRSSSSRRTTARAAPGGRTRYPGARVDVGSHFYSYSFEPADHWTEFFSAAARAAGVLPAGARRSTASREHIRFGTEVVGATYDDATPAPGRSTSTTAESLTARAVVCAVGQLNRPFVPDVPGEFDGPAFHTAALGPTTSTSPASAS